MLHIVSRSPIEHAILERIDTGDAVLFIENAVLGLLKQGQLSSNLTQLLKKARLYALAPDLEVRGISSEQLIPGIEAIDYSGFVELTVENAVIHSWC